MRVAIVGYGRMGHMIYSAIQETKGASVVAVIDPWSPGKEVTALNADEDSLKDADVVIDFSVAASVRDNALLYAKMGLPAVIGTTGWYDELDAIRNTLSVLNAKIIYSGNFSIGIAMFMSIVSKAAALVDKIDSYDIALSEIHHRNKADAPSGTLLMLGEKVLSSVSRKNRMLIGNPEGKIDPDALHLSSLRVGDEPGTHTVMIDSKEDAIILEHRARSREGFAKGAVRAAEWIIGREPGLYTMNDFIGDFLGE